MASAPPAPLTPLTPPWEDLTEALAFAFPQSERSGAAPGGEAGLDRDRQSLRTLGVPGSWTRHLRGGDRFAAVLAMLDRLPQADFAVDAPVVAVVGAKDVVHLEAHRTAVDLPDGDEPRPVVTVPTRLGEERREAVSRAARTRPVVVAVEANGYQDPAAVRRALRSVRADVVIAVVDARARLEDTTRWVEALEKVDAVALDGAMEVEAPATVLQLDLPVVRLDGIPVDRVGWAALLCAQLVARDAR